MRRHKRLLGAFILLMFSATLIAPVLFAEDRVAEGAKDIGSGVVAVPRHVAETANRTNIVNGVVIGGTEGLLYTVKGIAEGVFKILTFYSKND